MGQSLPFISSIERLKFKVAIASKKIINKSAQANPVASSASSSSTNVPAHPYGTRQKMKALLELLGQTSSMLSYNPLYDSSSPTREPNFGVMNVMTTNTTSLEEKVEFLVKMVESLTASPKEKDDQMTFMMKRLFNLTGKRLVNEEVQHENLPQELGEQSNVQFSKDPQPTINEVVTTNQLKELIKETIKDQVECVTQPSYTYAKMYFYMIDHLKMLASYQPPKFQ
ncbi:hypothetical protein Goarm_011319 [Gossypium armourianum]|uniref:Uncharacterized protein n=1 Tax=Gossypium armourianum TaxID=34283 RepID=A0A7J9IX72_9ROSI|nr:hypothetical protein [Gossypium armourianum]